MKVLGIDGGNVPSFCKRRQVARREEVHAGDSESRAQFGRTPRSVGEEPEQVEGDLVAALLQETRNAFGKRLGESIKLPLPHLLGLLLVSQVKRAVRDPTDLVITTIRLELAQSSHAAY